MMTAIYAVAVVVTVVVRDEDETGRDETTNNGIRNVYRRKRSRMRLIPCD